MKFTKGDEFTREGAYYTSYGIDANASGPEEAHLNQIEVYGDEELRDLIIELLTEHYKEEVK